MEGTAVELAAARTHLFRAGSKKVWPDTDSDDRRRIRQVECAQAKVLVVQSQLLRQRSILRFEARSPSTGWQF